MWFVSTYVCDYLKVCVCARECCIYTKMYLEKSELGSGGGWFTLRWPAVCMCECMLLPYLETSKLSAVYVHVGVCVCKQEHARIHECYECVHARGWGKSVCRGIQDLLLIVCAHAWLGVRMYVYMCACRSIHSLRSVCACLCGRACRCSVLCVSECLCVFWSTPEVRDQTKIVPFGPLHSRAISIDLNYLHCMKLHITFKNNEMWCNDIVCATYLTHMCGATHSWVWHASFVCVLCLD